MRTSVPETINLRHLNFKMNLLQWTNQTPNNEKWISFPNPQQRTITLPPRRYIVIRKVRNQITNEQLTALKTDMDKLHTISNAPEPMTNLTSHFEVMMHRADNTKTVISLTNLSSRKPGRRSSYERQRF
jgi:hypothetical protein